MGGQMPLSRWHIVSIGSLRRHVYGRLCHGDSHHIIVPSAKIPTTKTSSSSLWSVNQCALSQRCRRQGLSAQVRVPWQTIPSVPQVDDLERMSQPRKLGRGYVSQAPSDVINGWGCIALRYCHPAVQVKQANLVALRNFRGIPESLFFQRRCHGSLERPTNEMPENPTTPPR